VEIAIFNPPSDILNLVFIHKSSDVERNVMPEKKRLRTLDTALRVVTVVFMLTLLLTPPAWAASKFKTLYQGGKNGSFFYAGVTFDSAGNLYGTTHGGGAYKRGTVFKLTPNGDGRWKETLLHSFEYDGVPGGLILDHVGNLYGIQGNTIFQLTANGDGTWTESLLYIFCQLDNCSDGQVPVGSLIFDQAGNLYGTTWEGGAFEWGTVFKLAPNQDGTWTETVLFNFSGGPDGKAPSAGLILDPAGNLYGTTYLGGNNNHCGSDGCGVVFKLSQNENGTWTESVLHSFEGGNDGSGPGAGLTFDSAGNLYGTTSEGGVHVGGTVFQLTPNSDGSWTESVLHSFQSFGKAGKDGSDPAAGLILDLAGNLYGTTAYGGAYNYGTVFKLKPTVNSGWKETVLHSFGSRPGAYPVAGLTLDSQGRLYGTTRGYMRKSPGSVFELTP
jgi:uncharacterized repeat protein (TIGR03803 family)